MRPRRVAPFWGLLGLGLTVAGPARAQRETPAEGESAAPAVSTEVKPRKSRWHGSIAHFDQSIGTQTAGLGADYQSHNPVYEWWFAFKPRLYAYETRVEYVSLHGWANLYWELTNSDTTTYRNEPVLGPTWLWANYGRTIFERGDVKTSLFFGPRFRLPTDKESRNAGLIASAGGGVGFGQTFPIYGKGAPALPGSRFGFEARYFHPFNRSTTHVYPALGRVRQDVAGRTVVSDVLDGSMNTQHELWLLASGTVHITDKLNLTLTYVLINYWDYRPPETPICSASTGCVTPSTTTDPTRYRVRPWVLASIDYDVIDEMSLSLGYYNLASQIGPDGQRRSPFWSPDARVFFTVVGNLDVIYDTLTKDRSQRDAVARALPANHGGAGGF